MIMSFDNVYCGCFRETCITCQGDGIGRVLLVFITWGMSYMSDLLEVIVPCSKIFVKQTTEWAVMGDVCTVSTLHKSLWSCDNVNI